LQRVIIPIAQALDDLMHEAVVYSGNSSLRNHFGG